jgi:hypothetical protein
MKAQSTHSTYYYYSNYKDYCLCIYFVLLVLHAYFVIGLWAVNWARK